MKGVFCIAAATAVLTGCAGMGDRAPTAPAGPAIFTLSSPAFKDGGTLEQRHAGNAAGNPNCVGQNVSPPLAWTHVPAGTRSLAMLVYDQEGRSGLGVAHWVAYNIPTTVNSFQENEIIKASPKYTGGKSTLNLATYMGPCAPAQTGMHHYVFTVIATDVEPGSLPAGLTMPELLDRLNGHAKGASSMVLHYGRP